MKLPSCKYREGAVCLKALSQLLLKAMAMANSFDANSINSFHKSCLYAFFVFQVCCALSRFARFVVWLGGRNNKGRKEEKDVGSQRRKRHRPGHKTNVDNANNLDADNTRGDKGE